MTQFSPLTIYKPIVRTSANLRPYTSKILLIRDRRSLTERFLLIKIDMKDVWIIIEPYVLQFWQTLYETCSTLMTLHQSVPHLPRLLLLVPAFLLQCLCTHMVQRPLYRILHLETSEVNLLVHNTSDFLAAESTMRPLHKCDCLPVHFHLEAEETRSSFSTSHLCKRNNSGDT